MQLLNFSGIEKGDKMHIALKRRVSPSIKCCELTHLTREPINLRLTRQQHRQYQQAVADLGCQVHSLPSEPDLPVSVFMEDAAKVLDELGVITLPGAVSRRAEVYRCTFHRIIRRQCLGN